VTDCQPDDIIDDISCFRSKKELLVMDKEEKRLAVLEACDQEHLMRQEGEELGARGTGTSGGSGGQTKDRDKESGINQESDEYSDSMSTAVDEVIYHRLLDSLDVIRAEQNRIREERDRNLEALVDAEGDLLDIIPETQEESGKGRRGISLEDGQLLFDSDDDAYGGTPSPREECSGLELGKADVSGTGGWIGESRKSNVASSMDVSSPKITSARSITGRGEGGAGPNTEACSGNAKDKDTEEDCKDMQYDTDLAEDVYYYILKAPQPWTVGRIYRAAIRTFTGTDRPTLHATIVATLVTLRKTAQHVLMSSIRTGAPSPEPSHSGVHGSQPGGIPGGTREDKLCK